MLHFLVLTTEDTQAVLFYRDTSIKNNIFHNFGILITIHLLENGKQTSFNLKDSAKKRLGLNPKRFLSSIRFTSCIFYLIRKSGYRRRSLKEVHQVQRSTMCQKVTDKRTLKVRRRVNMDKAKEWSLALV